MPTVQTFKDLSVTFKKHPVNDDLIVVRDKAAIAQSMKNLLLTQRGERPFQPELGCDIASILFEPLDYGSGVVLKSEIKNVIVNYEPRVVINKLFCFPNEALNGYEVELSYSIIGREDRPVTVEFFLERTR
jgi:hypothetical protein